MRLKPREIDVIKQAARQAFGPDTIVRLFGSRLDDSRRGGDIDLHVDVGTAEAARSGGVSFRLALLKELDEEPVDVVVHHLGAERRWIDEIAYRDGVVL